MIFSWNYFTQATNKLGQRHLSIQNKFSMKKVKLPTEAIRQVFFFSQQTKAQKFKGSDIVGLLLGIKGWKNYFKNTCDWLWNLWRITSDNDTFWFGWSLPMISKQLANTRKNSTTIKPYYFVHVMNQTLYVWLFQIQMIKWFRGKLIYRTEHPLNTIVLY